MQQNCLNGLNAGPIRSMFVPFKRSVSSYSNHPTPQFAWMWMSSDPYVVFIYIAPAEAKELDMFHSGSAWSSNS